MATLVQSFCNSNASENGKPNKSKAMIHQKTNLKIQNRYADSLNPKITGTTHPKAIHAQIIKTGIQPHHNLITQILFSYGNFGYLEEALHLFERTKNPDTFLWNTMIMGYAKNGFFEEAIEFYRRMQFAGVYANHFTFPFVIKSCSGLFCFWEGQKTHGCLIKNGLDSDIFVCNALITLYATLGYIELAHQVFDEMSQRDLVSWNSLIGGYVADGDGCWKSLSCFREMQALGLEPDRFSLIGVLAACSLGKCEKQGKAIHAHIIRFGFEPDVMLETSVVDMYCKCSNMNLAERLFHRISRRNVIVWNTLIAGYNQNNQPLRAFSCSIIMQAEANPNSITMVSLLPSCAKLRALLLGKCIHGFAIRKGFLPCLVLETALIDMYAKCGKFRSARKLFDRMPERNLVSWNAMIAGSAQNGYNIEAMALFQSLQQRYLKPDAITISSILPAYAGLASLQPSKQIHGYVTKCGYNSNTFISNSIIHMYAKCGDLHIARNIFDWMPSKDIVSWNTMIAGYGIHGCGHGALELFSKMQEKGIKPNGSTFVSVLSSCSTSGLVHEGWKYLISMQQDYGIDPQIEHYGCMVDLLGRSKSLDLAESFIKRMPLAPTARIWGSLLGASRYHKNIELAERAAKHILALEHDNTGCYVLLSNMYAEARRWGDVERMRLLMKQEGLEKTKGRSTVELNSKTSSFVAGNRSHPETWAIYEILYILTKKIGEVVYVPDTMFTPSEVIRKKENLPNSHSVRLALCFGLISTAVGNPILIKKNVRICNDCHHAVKLISRVTRREITVGDSRTYHHFKDGFCSCGDYW